MATGYRISIERECTWKVQTREMVEHPGRWQHYDYYENEETARRIAAELHAPERHWEARAIPCRRPVRRRDTI